MSFLLGLLASLAMCEPYSINRKTKLTITAAIKQGVVESVISLCESNRPLEIYSMLT